MKLLERLIAGDFHLPVDDRNEYTREQFESWHKVAALIHSYIASTKNELILIDNVARYMMESAPAGTNWDLLDFPNVAPPFEVFFMEFRVPPPPSTDTKWAQFGMTGIARHGVQFIVRDRVKTPDDQLDEPFTKLGIPPTARWAIMAAHFYEKNSPDIAIGPLAIWHYFVDGEGRFLAPTSAKNGGPQGIMLPCNLNRSKDALAVMFPAALATSFLHCKNVKITTDEMFPALVKKHQRKHPERQPVLRWHRLDIDPMREMLRQEGQSESLGLKRALHIVRGHFAHYTEERPLFGKVVGTFWMPQHARGTIEAGAVRKTYNVKAK